MKNKIEEISSPDLVYISHIHNDHCEEETLKHISKDTPIVIMDLPPNFLYKRLRYYGFNNIRKLKAGELSKIPEIDSLYAEPFGASFGHICANVIDRKCFLKSYLRKK